MMLSETSLNSDFLDSELGLHSYRCLEQTAKSRNGGKLIAVHSTLRSMQLPVLFDEYEAVWVLIELGKVKRIFYCFYTLPNSKPVDYQRFCDTLESIRELW